MVKVYLTLSALMSAFWAAVITLGLQGSPGMFAIVFLVVFPLFLVGLCICRTAAER